MGKFFGEKLKQHRKIRGVSGYLICERTGLKSPTFIAIEKGRRPPSAANLEALASMPELGVTIDQLQAWLDMDKVGGEEGFRRMAQEFPEYIGLRFEEIKPFFDAEMQRIIQEHDQGEHKGADPVSTVIAGAVMAFAGVVEANNKRILDDVRKIVAASGQKGD